MKPESAPFLSEPLLVAQDVAVHYGGVKALEGVSLCLTKGRIHGLIGPNGAGKSTIIDALTGRCALVRGRVMLQGEDVSRMGVVARRRRGLSRSFQRASIFGQMTVREQVELAASSGGLANSETDAATVLEELGLSQVAETEGASLGYGQQRRLDVALALVGAPSVLLLDEPMAGLSVPESHEVAGHLQALASVRGISVLLVEHDMDVVFGISDEVAVMDLGRIIAVGTPAQVRCDPRVRRAYLGDST